MERYKCRLCFKSFINGKALGGHMRSHMPSSKHEQEVLLLDDDNDDTSSSSEEFDNLKRMVHFEDGSEISPRKKRSKRTRKLGSFDELVVTEPEHHSSTSDTTTEEDLAFCLMLLSRDKWNQEEDEEEEEEEDYECEEDYKSSSKNVKGRGGFKCETCGKVFKSYQALGGHRASHKKNKTFTSTRTEFDHVIKEKKIHQCPICFRVFSSGQALGGHKRSHGSSNNQQLVRIDQEDQVMMKDRMIDLNLPAPNEDEDDNETSLVFDEW